METPSKLKKSYPSAAQKARLIALIEADKELHQGKFSSTFTKKESEKRWLQIAEEVNSVSGAKKGWTEWRKTWQDMKSSAKKKHSTIRHSVHSTGGGPPTQPLSQDEMAILSTMAGPTLVGHTDSSESLVEFIDLETPSATVSDTSGAIATQGWNRNKDLETPSATVSDTSGAIATQGWNRNKDLETPSATVSDTSGAIATQGWNRNKESPVLSSDNSATAVHTSMEKNKENTSAQKRKPVGRRRQLEQSLNVASNLQNHLTEKFKIKKEFYNNVLKEMSNQTKILMSISNSLSRLRPQIQNQEVEVEIVNIDHDYL